MLLILKPGKEELGREAARIVANAIRRNPALRLGLATGSTTLGMYKELVRLHRDESLDFSQVVTFNLDEYLGLSATRPQSFHHFMQQNFFAHVNIPPASIHIPDGTVARDYTRTLIHEFAVDCEVTLVGAPRLAGLAEQALRGEAVADADIAGEIAPGFIERGGRRTDQIVLACTHFPLLVERLAALSPWPVAFVDPAPAIARRVVELLGPARPHDGNGSTRAIFTSGRVPETALARFGIRASEPASTSAG